MNRLVCVIPAQKIRINDFKKICKQLNKLGISKLILASPVDLTNYSGLFRGGFIYVKTVDGTKLDKLKATSKFIGDDEMIFVLDSDDYLNTSFKIDNFESDLVLMPYLKQHRGNPLNYYSLVKFDKTNFVWNKNGTPYFGNHSMIVSGKIFNSANKILNAYDFQRHEDVVRSLIYISLSKNQNFLDEKRKFCLIKRRKWNSKMSASNIDDQVIGGWLKMINQFLMQFEIKFNNQPKLQKSQVSSLIEIKLTTERLVKKNILKEQDVYDFQGK